MLGEAACGNRITHTHAPAIATETPMVSAIPIAAPRANHATTAAVARRRKMPSVVAHGFASKRPPHTTTSTRMRTIVAAAAPGGTCDPNVIASDEATSAIANCTATYVATARRGGTSYFVCAARLTSGIVTYPRPPDSSRGLHSGGAAHTRSLSTSLGALLASDAI